MKPLLLLLTLLMLSASLSLADGIKGKPAPHLEVDEWVSLPEGQEKGPTLADLKGKVIYLYCFQSWCPGCHSSGFPTLQAMIKEFRDDPDVRFVAVQTVFEGFGTNTPEAARKIVERYKLESIPVGQSGAKGTRSKIMADYRTRGTPWTVIIAPDGTVNYNDFHIEPDAAAKLIRSLKTTAKPE